MQKEIIEELIMLLEHKVKELNIIKEEFKDYMSHDLKNVLNNDEKVYHYCDICGCSEIMEGKITEEMNNRWHLLKRDGSEVAGYGSILDGRRIAIEVCDNCMQRLMDRLTLSTNTAMPKEVEDLLNERDANEDNC